MLANRPDLIEYAQLTDDLYEYKKKLGKAEWELDKICSINMKSAIRRKAIGKEIDVIKIIGEDQDDLLMIEDLKNKIFDLKKSIGTTTAKIKVWEYNKELYISDSYHTRAQKWTATYSDDEKDEN